MYINLYKFNIFFNLENGCSDEDKWALGQDIKKVLESKNGKI